MRKLTYLTLTGLLCLSACGTHVASQNGLLKFKVVWPQSQTFRIQAMPEATEFIEVQIFNALGELEFSTRLTKAEGTQVLNLSLTIGNKEIRITAFDATERAIARSQSQVLIQAGEVSRIESELIPLDLSSPSGSGNTGNSPPVVTPSSQPNPAPTASSNSDSTAPEDTVSPETPSASDAPEPNPTPSPTATSGSSGGGGGGGSSASGPSLSLTATPSTLPGMGYSTFVEAIVSDNSTPTSVSWSCTPPTGATACGSFADPTAAKTVWKAPVDSSEFGDNTVKSVSFTLTAAVTLSSGSNLSSSITITANRGNGGTTAIPGPPDQGNFDGGQD